MTEQQIRQEIETIENEVLPRLARELKRFEQRRRELLELVSDQQRKDQ